MLEWLKDWGNLFNKAASTPSFVEHLQALTKLEQALSVHLTTYTPIMTSSNPNYEKCVREFIDQKFLGRFASYREYHAASIFRKRMVEHDLWDEWLEWCDRHVDFQKASNMDAGQIYKMCSLITKKFLGMSKPCKVEKTNGSTTTGSTLRYSWGSLAFGSINHQSLLCFKLLVLLWSCGRCLFEV